MLGALLGSGRLAAATQGQSTAATSSLIDSLASRPDLSTTVAWQALSSHRLPYMETLPGQPGQSLVTIAWLGDTATHNVVVITPLTLIDFSGSVMHRLGQTTVWYATFRLPTDTRFAYRFAPNDNLVPFERDTNIFARLRTMRRDPANPNVFSYGAFGDASVLQLPNAPIDTLVKRREGTPHGIVSSFTIASHVLGQDRQIWIYTPPLYARQRRAEYKVALFADGQSYQDLIPTPTILDNLIAGHAIRPVIAVFVDNPSATREQDLDCSPRWTSFLTEELMPWLSARYHIAREARDRIVAGYSLGGLAAACAAMQRPDVFGAVIAQSGSFFRAPAGEQPEWLARRLTHIGRLPIRWVMSIGLYETAAIPSRDPSMLTASRHLRDVLLAKGYAVTYRELASGHEHVAWRAVLGDALRQALADQ
jgi:enterochelin esterase-like enzyme